MTEAEEKPEKEVALTKCKECGGLLAHDCTPDLVISLLLTDGSVYPCKVEGVSFTMFVQDWQHYRKQKNADGQMVIVTDLVSKAELALYMKDVRSFRAVLPEQTLHEVFYTLRYP